jgi:DNA (cytosine-5)-methyltransferase 1
MAKGYSGRVVVEMNPALKKRLYSKLSLSGSTLKDWLHRTATEYCLSEESLSPLPEFKGSSLPTTFSEDPNRYGVSQKDTVRKSRFSIISLFSGCGGMDLGFLGGFEFLGRNYENLPFHILWANDINAEACRTYRKNIGHEIRQGDVWELLNIMPSSADVLIGGFPCQDISVNGKQAGVNGNRSGLYKAMIKAIQRVKPRVFVAENVKALLRNPVWLEQVLRDFGSLGYNMHHQLYQAADYGVPQTRERVLIVGTASGVPPYQPPAQERHPASWVTAQQAIWDLERLDESPQINHIWSLANKSPEQGNRRLIADRPGYTIRAECHGNIQYHYKLPRRISMREAARIQSFPDNFLFVSGLRETERQVGNAVPPVLAWHVARSVLECLKSSETNAPKASKVDSPRRRIDRRVLASG